MDINMAELMPDVYNCSIILYNYYLNEVAETEQYFGTRFDNVKVDISQAANIQATGLEDANVCTVTIPKPGIEKPYIPAEKWNDLTAEEMADNFTVDTGNRNFFVVAKKPDSNVDEDLPVGVINSRDYEGGWYQYAKDKYGYVFLVKTLDEPTLIPSFVIGGR